MSKCPQCYCPSFPISTSLMYVIFVQASWIHPIISPYDICDNFKKRDAYGLYCVLGSCEIDFANHNRFSQNFIRNSAPFPSEITLPKSFSFLISTTNPRSLRFCLALFSARGHWWLQWNVFCGQRLLSPSQVTIYFIAIIATQITLRIISFPTIVRDPFHPDRSFFRVTA